MTNRERMIRAMLRQPVDRVPVSPVLYFMYPMRVSGHSSWNLLGVRGPAYPCYKAVVDAYRKFGFESWVKTSITTPDIGDVSSETYDVEPGVIETKTVHTLNNGTLTQRVAYQEYDADYITEYLFPDPQENKKLIVEYMEAMTASVNKSSFETIENARNYSGEGGIVSACIYSFGAWWQTVRGSEHGLIDFMEYPDLMREFHQIYFNYFQKHAMLSAQSPADILYGIGTSHSTLSLISPQIWQDYVYPYACEAARIGRNHSKPVCYMAGNIGMRLLPGLLDSGVDAISPCERPPLGDWDVKAMRKIAGENLCIVGNVDPVSTLLFAGPDKIRDEVRGIFADAGTEDGTGLIIATSDQVCRDTPDENLAAMKQAADECNDAGNSVQ